MFPTPFRAVICDSRHCELRRVNTSKRFRVEDSALYVVLISGTMYSNLFNNCSPMAMFFVSMGVHSISPHNITFVPIETSPKSYIHD